MMPCEASAASGEYVPVKGSAVIVVTNSDGSDGGSGHFDVSFSFDKKGRIKSFVDTWPDEDWNYEQSFKWNKNLIVSVTTEETGKAPSTETHKYKNGRETKYVSVSGDGDKYVTKYKWNKKGTSAGITQTATLSSGRSYVITGTRKLDKKKQITKESFTSGNRTSTVSYKYYKKGRRKSSQRSGNLKVNGHTGEKINYIKAGYMTSAKVTFDDGTAQTTSYKYVMDKKKKCPKKVVVTEKYNGETTVTTYVFTKFKKVSRVRNCDDSGNILPLAANL